jgi:cysteine desulfurase
MKIYLDFSATTPVDKDVLRAMKPYFSDIFGNPSSIHTYGQKAREAVDMARDLIAKSINSHPSEILFTSGGSESDNLAIRGIIEAKMHDKKTIKPHIITSKIEHKAVIETINRLKDEGKLTATFLDVNKGGQVNLEDIRRAIKPSTVLVSIMYVNNETGVWQPIRQIGKLIEKINKNIAKSGKKQRIYFHTDAVQAAQFMELNVDYLHVDLMSLSAHKIYGPKGIGLLYVRDGTHLNPQITGGKQENKLRAGTENVASIVGFSVALSKVNKEKEINSKKLKLLRDNFETTIKKLIPHVLINGTKRNRSPHISNLSFKGAEGESIILSLDLEGIAVSSGSACTSGSLEPSHVLIAMGVKPLLAQSSIRFSLGKQTTANELDIVVKKLKNIILRLRRISAIKE